MAVRKILTDKDPALHKKCHPITKFDNKLCLLLDDMRETLVESGGAGLAAPQIGILRRIAVVLDEQGEILEFINPELISQEGEQTDLEGCLSVPGYFGYVTRPMWATVRAQDRHGNWFEVQGEELVARCFCHELEHLDGHVFTEHTDRLYSGKELDELLEQEQRQKKRTKQKG